MNKYESTCFRCHETIRSTNGGGTWRHVKAPAVKHTAHAVGVMRQI